MQFQTERNTGKETLNSEWVWYIWRSRCMKRSEFSTPDFNTNDFLLVTLISVEIISFEKLSLNTQSKITLCSRRSLSHNRFISLNVCQSLKLFCSFYLFIYLFICCLSHWTENTWDMRLWALSFVFATVSMTIWST